MSIVLECKETRDFIPHPEGIHPAVCVDVIDLGLVDTEFQGQRRRVNKVKLVFETEQRMEDGRPFTVSKSFTASLHPKARLAEFIGKWRGRPLVPGEFFDLGKLVGACCTLVTSLQQNAFGRTYASIDAVSKPTRKVVPSGSYDPAAARQRLAEWKARQAANSPQPSPSSLPASLPNSQFPASMLPSVPPASPAAPSSTPPAASFPPGSKPQAPCSTLPTPPAADDVPF